MTIYKVEKRDIDEYGQYHPMQERFFSTYDKADAFLNSQLDKEKEWAVKIVDKGVCFSDIVRVVDCYLGADVYHTQWILCEVEVN